MSVAKLSTRFPGGTTPKIQEIIDAFGSHLEIDLQQRGVEFSQLFRKYNGMRTALLEQMPPMERDTTMLDEQPEQIQGMDNMIFVQVLRKRNKIICHMLGNDICFVRVGGGKTHVC